MGDVTAPGRRKTAGLTNPQLEEANRLMIAALSILDQERYHAAAAQLDHAIVTLGLRPEGEGMPPLLED